MTTISRDDVGAFFLDQHDEIWKLVAYTDQPTFCLKQVADEREAVWLVVGSEQAQQWRRLVIDGGTIVLRGGDPDWRPNAHQSKAVEKVLGALTRYRIENFGDPEWLKLRTDEALWPPTVHTLWGVRAYLDPELPADTVRLGDRRGVTDYSLLEGES